MESFRNSPIGQRVSKKLTRRLAFHDYGIVPNEGEYVDRKKRRRRQKRSSSHDKKKSLEEKLQTGNIPNSPETSSIPEKEDGEDFNILSAHTALLIPISYETEDTPLVIRELTARRFIHDGSEYSFWNPVTNLPNEIHDLSPQFRQFIGTPSPQKTWTCTRLTLNPKLMQSLFSRVRLISVHTSADEVEFPAHFESIELCVYPLGIAMLVFQVNWLPQLSELTLFDMRTIIFVAKHMNIVSDVCNGWALNDDSTKTPFNNPEEQLGSDVYGSRYGSTPISLKNLSAWILKLPHSKTPTSRLNVLRHAYHHAVVVVDRELPTDVLNEYLFHMRRGFGQTNRPPVNSSSTLGKVLVWRLNRYLGLSREGIISLSWPIAGEHSSGSAEYEVSKWHKKFLGIYLILALHAQGEKMVFNELSDLAVNQAEFLQPSQNNFNQIKVAREELRNLATMMARYTLGMSSGDCGGTTEYSEFFVNLRKELGIPDLRSELSEELKDVLAVVESNYLEEERAQRDQEEGLRKEKYQREKNYRFERERKLRRFEFVASVVGAFTLPFVVIGGIFGMNLGDMPQPPFWVLMLATSISAIILLVVMTVINFYRRGNCFSFQEVNIQDCDHLLIEDHGA